MLPDIELLKRLIQTPSVTPADNGCIKLLEDFFNKPALHFNRNKTSNAYIEVGEEGPLFVFVGHTDVVEPGPLDKWTSPPFKLTQTQSGFVGRGMVDMKGAIWAFCSALKAINQKLSYRVGILLTSDEEGDGKDGMQYMVEKLKDLNFYANWALVGEPTSKKHIGDYYKHQRRGSCSFEISLHGRQGHIAYPEQALNPAQHLETLLTDIGQINKNLTNPDHLEIYSIESSTHTSNIIPETILVRANMRYLHEKSPSFVQNKLQGANRSLKTIFGAKPYQSNPSILKKSLTNAIEKHTRLAAQPSISGGASDARFLSPIAKEIIEFGLSSNSAHQINEFSSLDDLLVLQKIYLELMVGLNNIEKSDNSDFSIYNSISVDRV